MKNYLENRSKSIAVNYKTDVILPWGGRVSTKHYQPNQPKKNITHLQSDMAGIVEHKYTDWPYLEQKEKPYHYISKETKKSPHKHRNEQST